MVIGGNMIRVARSACWYSMVVFTIILASKELPRRVAGAVVDLGHGYHDRDIMCADPTKRFEIFDVKTFNGPNGAITLESFSTPEHCGTHLDAPFHFNPGGWKLENIPLERLVVEGKSI